MEKSVLLIHAKWMAYNVSSVTRQPLMAATLTMTTEEIIIVP